jgi:hypothetical protein
MLRHGGVQSETHVVIDVILATLFNSKKIYFLYHFRLFANSVWYSLGSWRKSWVSPKFPAFTVIRNYCRGFSGL